MVHHAAIKITTLIFIYEHGKLLNIEQARKNTNMHLHGKKSGKIYTKMFRIVILLIGGSWMVFFF